VRSKPKEFRYAIELDAGGGLHTESGAGLVTAPEWTPEHLVLAGLVRCSLDSLRHHAKRVEVEVTGARAGASALVTRRESDGRYAVVAANVELAVELAPEPGREALAELLAKAERDCFVGASLTAEPAYRWRVNGRTA
jgi:uncharacterized OsmC-like protein